MAYSREVGADLVRAAEFQNYARQPEPVRRALRSVPRDSDAYQNAMWALRGAEDELSGRFAGQRLQQEVMQRAAPSFSPTIQGSLLQALGADPAMVEQARSAPRSMRTNMPAAAPAAEPYNVGYVNGKAVMAPTPGNYGRVLGMRGRAGVGGDTADLGLADYQAAQDRFAGQGLTNDDMDFGQLARAAQAQANAQAQAAQKARQQKLDDEALAHRRAVELEGVRGKAPVTANEDARKFHGERLKQHQKDQAEAGRLEMLTRGKTPDELIDIGGGNYQSAGSVRAQAAGLRYKAPTYEDSLRQYGTPEANQEAEQLQSQGLQRRQVAQTSAGKIPPAQRSAARAHFQQIAASDPDPARRAEAQALLEFL